MKIAFVNLQLSNELSGVGQAIIGQANACRAQGLPIDFWVVNPEKTGIEQGIHFARFDAFPIAPRLTRAFKARALSQVRELDEYDVIFLRYPLAIDLAPLAFIRTARAKVVTVHHAKELDELFTEGKGVGMIARAALEFVNGGRVLRHVAGIVGVTDEIRRHELRRAWSHRPSRTIANGIDVAAIPLTGFVPFDGKHLRMLFIASSKFPWHGTDRLIASLKRYSGNVKLHLDLVGDMLEAPAGTVETFGALTVQHHGTLRGQALDDVFSKITLAFSSLAAFRKGIRQGCALKTREYVARGLPFVLGYDDVDLMGSLPFCLQVPNEERPFDLEPIIAFATKAAATPALSSLMRSFAQQHLDWSSKMHQFHEFAQALTETTE